MLLSHRPQGEWHHLLTLLYLKLFLGVHGAQATI